ncbi:signal recognition particle-docking protein FtsY [soil metagenome]
MVAVLAFVGLAFGGVAVRRARRRDRPRVGARAPGRDAPPTAQRHAPPSPPETPVEAGVPSEGLATRIRSLFRGGEASEQAWRGLEEALIRADVGPAAAGALVRRVRASYRPPADPAMVVANEIAAMFEDDPRWIAPVGSPGIVMVVGVNGTGKTTTIGKLAHRLSAEGCSVSLAASDTFRAAAGEQLTTWAKRARAHVVAQSRGADPGAVAFDAVKAAQARGSDVLIVDTAGRLHTRQPLMEELRKVKRVLEKAGGRVDEVLLVLDATTGQNGIAQARAFTDAVDVTGLVLAKMDGTARGGIVLAVRQELGVPVKLVGTGERPDDLVPFDPREFARRLVA